MILLGLILFGTTSAFVLQTPNPVSGSQGKTLLFSSSTETAAATNNVEKPSALPNVDETTSSKTTPPSLTERIMTTRIPVESQASGAGGASTWQAFQRVEANWQRLKEFQPFDAAVDSISSFQNDNGKSAAPPPFVTQDASQGSSKAWARLRELAQDDSQSVDYDVAICGGTLGIFFAMALLLKGHSVAVVEAGQLRGREQEWNISMDELLELVELGVLTRDDIDAAVQTEFPACRSGFKNQEVTPLPDNDAGYFVNGIGYECFTDDVLNLGIAPAVLLERVSQRFVQLGGVIRDRAPIQGICISNAVGAALDLSSSGDGDDDDKEDDDDILTARLVMDCMGNASPITRQQRYGRKPDGICAVVGSCAAGYKAETNLNGDIIYTNQPIKDFGTTQGQLQYFWEAFPVGIGRNGNEPGTSNVKTTYMFTYMDADKDRPSLESIMEDYWKLLPIYQPDIVNPETDLDFRRVLFAYFPTYRDSPVQPAWNRLLAVGDASGIQSPLSFGGFGALTRHLGRISTAVDEALQSNLLHKSVLGEINAYTPNLSAAWMFQKAMSVRMGQSVDPTFVNRLLAVNFQAMNEMGLRTIKPFLQDVIRFDGLVGSLTQSFVRDPTFMPQIVAHVGIPTLAEWVGHVAMMGLYSALDSYVSPLLGPWIDCNSVMTLQERFVWRRRMDAWKFGSGNDYQLPPDEPEEEERE